MNTSRKILTTALAAITLTTASLAVGTPAFAKGGKGGHIHNHFRHDRHFRFRDHRWDSCWIFTKRFGWINVCGYDD
jgi:hypothetical protein